MYCQHTFEFYSSTPDYKVLQMKQLVINADSYDLSLTLIEEKLCDSKLHHSHANEWCYNRAWEYETDLQVYLEGCIDSTVAGTRVCDSAWSVMEIFEDHCEQLPSWLEWCEKRTGFDLKVFQQQLEMK